MNLWDEILARVETKVNRHSFYTWFKPTTFVAEDTVAVTVRVPNPLFKDWLTKHYAGVITEAMGELKKPGLQVNFVSDTSGDALPIATERRGSRGARGRRTTAAVGPGPAGLNPRYTFDTFIVGSSNQFAHAACRAVGEAPSRSYNPLFIYGGVGLGKTHLMHAIGQYVLRHDRKLKLTYISAERFMNEMINAVRYDRIIDFRERYRTVDVLLVDDVQFIAGKEGTQTEFFHTFNALYDSQKQIVISSDCPPHEIPSLEERLRSRFEWGLIADIQSPDLETKVAILKKKADAEAVPLPDNVAIYIAGRIKSNIRELEGSLIRLIAYASLTGQEITLPLAQEVLEEHPRLRRQGRHDRDHPEVRRRLLQLEARRAEVTEQLEIDRDAAPGRDVPLQVADACIPPGNRPQLRRQAPLDGDPLDPQDRGHAPERWRFQHADHQFSRRIPVMFRCFPQARVPAPADRVWINLSRRPAPAARGGF